MQGAALRCGALVIAVWVVAGAAFAASTDVTDGDRVWENFNREAAVVGDKHFWLELRGLKLMDDQGIKQKDAQGLTFHGPTLGLNGYPLNDPKCSQSASSSNRCIDSIDGGRFDLVGAFGLGANSEIGIDLPFVVVEQISFTPPNTPGVPGGGSEDHADIGDIVLYGKIKRQLTEHVAGALGVELNLPSGSTSKLLGSGDFGLNPFLSTRYQSGRVGLGAHAGFLLNTGSQPDIFNWSFETILRGNQMFALRCEVDGRLFHAIGETFNDIAVWPGIDFNLTDNLVIRPQALAHVTKDAIDWGLGLGIAFTM